MQEKKQREKPRQGSPSQYTATLRIQRGSGGGGVPRTTQTGHTLSRAKSDTYNHAYERKRYISQKTHTKQKLSDQTRSGSVRAQRMQLRGELFPRLLISNSSSQKQETGNQDTSAPTPNDVTESPDLPPPRQQAKMEVRHRAARKGCRPRAQLPPLPNPGTSQAPTKDSPIEPDRTHKHKQAHQQEPPARPLGRASERVAAERTWPQARDAPSRSSSPAPHRAPAVQRATETSVTEGGSTQWLATHSLRAQHLPVHEYARSSDELARSSSRDQRAHGRLSSRTTETHAPSSAGTQPDHEMQSSTPALKEQPR